MVGVMTPVCLLYPPDRVYWLVVRWFCEIILLKAKPLLMGKKLNPFCRASSLAKNGVALALFVIPTKLFWKAFAVSFREAFAHPYKLEIQKLKVDCC